MTHSNDSSRPSGLSMIGETIGPYRLEKELGEGGMGTVYLAQQLQPVERHVALKLIKTERITERSILRFEIEKKTLSKLEHPFIAQVLDAGTSELGQPFFAMEYVDGTPITEYCDTHRLDIRKRLGLFAKVCKAIQHAHQHGIIHRDIKPSNILVSTRDGEAVPKVIDFGLAKMIAREDDSIPTDLTKTGLTVGSIGYMSPEQAKTTDMTVDTRTDIYSLGVVLYTLLVGTSPLEFGNRPCVAMLMMIKDEVPQKPSHRIMQMGDASESIAARRQTKRSRLEKQLKGDLDWIVMKALEKEPDRRYATTHDLADDICRYLADKPVIAGPPSWAYVTEKFIKRHKVGVFAAIAVLISILTGATSTSIGFIRAKKEAAYAKETALLLEEFLSSVQPGKRGKDLKVRELLDAFVPRLEELGHKPLIQSRLYLTYARTYMSLGLYRDALDFAQKSVALRKRVMGADHPATISSMTSLGNILKSLGKYTEAERIYRQCLQWRRQELGVEHPHTLSLMNNMGGVLNGLGKYDEAERIFHQCFETRKRVLGEEHPRTLSSMSNLAAVLTTQGKFSQAEALYVRVLEAQKRVLGDEHPHTLAAFTNLADNLDDQGKFVEAENLYRKVLETESRVFGNQHPRTLVSRNNLAAVLGNQGRFAEAKLLYDQCLKTQSQILGDEHPDTLMSMVNLARVYAFQGDLSQSERLHRQCLAIRKRVLGEFHPDTLKSMNSVAWTLACQEDHLDEAEELARSCVQAFLRDLGEHHPLSVSCMDTLAVVLEKRKKVDEAIRWYRRAAAGGDEGSKKALKRLEKNEKK